VNINKRIIAGSPEPLFNVIRTETTRSELIV